MIIKTVFDFNKALESGPYAWPGMYPLYFVTADGAALSWQAAIEEQNLIRDSIIDHPFNGDRWPVYSDGWRVVAMEVNYEDDDLYCDHTGEKIESAHGSDE